MEWPMDVMVIFPVAASLAGVSSALPPEHGWCWSGPGAGAFVAGSLGAAVLLPMQVPAPGALSSALGKAT